MNRTYLVALPLAVSLSCARTASAPRPAIAPDGAIALEAREITADQQVRHVLNRLAFGARPGDVAKVRGMSVDEWIAQQLAPAPESDTTVTALMKRYEMLALSPGELVR